jgi:hypothetical protein
MGHLRAWWLAVLLTCAPQPSPPSPGDGGPGGGSTASGGGGDAASAGGGAGGGSQDAGLACNGVGGGNEFEVVVAPTSLDFGPVAEGMTSDAGQITISSVISQGGYLDFSVVGPNASAFSFNAFPCRFLGSFGSQCSFDVFFRPTMPGDAGAVLVISSTGTGACVPLSGTGTTP